MASSSTTIASETIWPTGLDVAAVAGEGKYLYEKKIAQALYGPRQQYVVSGLKLPSSSANLNVTIPLGEAMVSGYYCQVPATLITAFASVTNYVYMKLTRDGNSKVTGAQYEVNDTGTVPADAVFLGSMVASGAAITSTADRRQFLKTGIVEEFSGQEDCLPYGAILANGQAVSRTGYPNLNDMYARAGYPYGAGDGSTTFNVPDRRGRVGIGLDNMGGTAAGRITSSSLGGANSQTLGGVGGAQTHTLQTTEMPAHTHALSYYTTSGANDIANSGSFTAGAANDTGSTGGGGAHNNTQPWIALNFMVWS